MYLTICLTHVMNCISSLAINIVAIKNKKNITFEFGICHFIYCALCFLVLSPIHCTIFFDMKMEWGDKENRIAVITLHKIGTLQLSITVFEVPVALESGENATMRCQYRLAEGESGETVVKWWWTSYNTTEEKTQLYQRIGSGQPGSRHNIEIKDNDTIVLLDAKPNNSGVYECEVSLMSEKIEEVRQHQELTIFTQGSGPNLTMSEVDDGSDEDNENDVLIECTVNDVAPAPDIMLTINSEEFSMTEYKTGPDADGLYDIVGNTTVSKDAVDGMEVRCELFYVNEKVLHPPYFFAQVYYASGAPTTVTKTPENVTEPDATPDSLQNPSGDSCQTRLSWVLLFALGVLTQVPALL